MDDLNKIAPKLSKIRKDSHFKIPEDYFDSFPSRLSDKIHAEKDTGLKRRYVLKLKPYLAIAAIFAGMVITGVVAYNVFNSGTTRNEPGRDEIATLINDDIYNYPEEIIMDVIVASDSKSDNAAINDKEEDLSNEVIDYLIDENIDMIDIIDAL